MDRKQPLAQTSRCQSELWRSDEGSTAFDDTVSPKERNFAGYSFSRSQSESQPNVRDQTRVLELLGRINYKIIKGKRVYIEAGGVVYKTLYGGYWRSVFTGVEHYLFRCEQVSSIWSLESSAESAVDLPIVFSNNGWTANGHSLSFMLANDQEELKRRGREILQKISRRWHATQLFGVR